MTQRMTCHEAMRQFFAYLDRALSGEALEGMEVHLDECLNCCDKLAFSRQVDTFVRERLDTVEPPPGLADRLRQRLALARPRGAGVAVPDVDSVLDGGTRACGELLLELKATLDGMRAGEVLQLISEDPGARIDLPIWCRMTRHTLLWHDETNYYIRRRAQ